MGQWFNSDMDPIPEREEVREVDVEAPTPVLTPAFSAAEEDSLSFGASD